MARTRLHLILCILFILSELFYLVFILSKH
jgi:hypothetical protein